MLRGAVEKALVPVWSLTSGATVVETTDRYL